MSPEISKPEAAVKSKINRKENLIHLKGKIYFTHKRMKKVAHYGMK